MISYLFNFFQRLEARLKRSERLRIKRLEADLAQAKLALSFYSRADSYPTFTVAGQQTSILRDRGARARQTLRSLLVAVPGRAIDVRMSLAEAQEALNNEPEPMSWSVYRSPEGQSKSERRAVEPV